MVNEANIVTVALEGIHGVGKTTQIDLITTSLSSVNVPSLVLRGDGSRSGIGDHEGNPISIWWQEHDAKLFTPECIDDVNYWNEVSHRLVRELRVWRERFFPRCLSKNGFKNGVIVLDRSILSRAIFLENTGQLIDSPEIDFSLLYPEIPAGSVVPDIILELFVPKDIAIQRLDRGSKYEFKREMIEKNFEQFYGLKNRLTSDLRDRIITIDAKSPPETIHERIMRAISLCGVSYEN